MPSYLLLETGDHLLLESGDDLLLEIVDQTIDLGLIDDSQVFGPSVSAAGLISLPLLDDSGVLPPSISATVTVALPLVDDSAVFAPGVYVDQTISLPLLDGGEVFAPSISFDQSLNLPLLDGGWPFPPNVVGEVVAGLVVKNGATVLDESFARSFRDELSAEGSHQLSVANDDPDLPDYDDVLRYYLDSRPVFAGLVEAKRVVTFSPGEEADEVTAISGRGSLALTDESTVMPSRGLDALPVETTRSFAWMSPDYTTVWPNSKHTLTPLYAGPEWWPDLTAWWVWADRPDVFPNEAPGGRCLFRGEFTLDEDATLRIFAGLDNYGPVYFDGALVMEGQSYRNGQYVDIDATAGEHVIALSCLNTGRHGGVIYAIYKLDADGLLDELVTHSNSTNTKCLPYPYPNNMPGFTAGEAIRIIVEEAQADGELSGISLGFTDAQDSDGAAWLEVAEITAEVGRSPFEVLQSLGDWLVDVQMAPGANVLRAWNWGTRGGTPGVTIAATDDPVTSEVEGLSHDGRGTRATRLLVRYKRGWTTVGSAGKTKYLDLGHVETETAAKRIAEKILQVRNSDKYAHTLQLAPVGNTPYDAFDLGDTITHLDQTGAANPQRVRSIALTQDDENDALTWLLETNDLRMELEERLNNGLNRIAPGQLAGGAKVTTRSGDALAPQVQLTSRNLAEFSFQDPVDGVATGKRPAESSGNLIEIYAEVSTEDDSATSSATVVRVLQYVFGQVSPTTLGTVTVPAGDESASLDLACLKVHKDSYKYRAEVVTVGGGVNGVDVQLRAI